MGGKPRRKCPAAHKGLQGRGNSPSNPYGGTKLCKHPAGDLRGHGALLKRHLFQYVVPVAESQLPAPFFLPAVVLLVGI
jgi:hypothetical protein